MNLHFCLVALEEALQVSQPTIFNSDQGSQFTSLAFTWALERRAIQILKTAKGGPSIIFSWNGSGAR
jgi:putative transposase